VDRPAHAGSVAPASLKGTISGHDVRSRNARPAGKSQRFRRHARERRATTPAWRIRGRGSDPHVKLPRWFMARRKIHGDREAHGGPGTWTIGSHLGPSPEPSEPAPDYIEEAAEPSEADWGHEIAEYRAKND
jgi:hypothetical protein